MESLSEAAAEEIQFAFPCRKRVEGTEVWAADSMLHVDAMMRPHILTRVKGHDVCEYTRFRAEANAVLVQVNGGITRILPEPAKAEYVSTQEEITLPPPIQQDSPVATPSEKVTSMSD